MWLIFALLSAIFAALTSILAKVGIDGVNSNLATAIRTVVVVAMAWGMVFLTNAQSGIAEISKKSWIFLILSGLATGASWLCYYKALQVGEASKVVPIDKLSVVITLPSVDKGRHGFDGQKCAHTASSPLTIRQVFSAGLFLSGRISAPAKLPAPDGDGYLSDF